MTILRKAVSKPTLSLCLGLVLATPLTAAALDDGSSQGNQEPSVAQIVADSIAATGGEKLDAVGSVRRRGEMHLESDLFGVLDGSWDIAYRPGQMGYQSVDFGVAVTETAWDGTTGWESSAMGLRDLGSQELTVNLWLWEPSFLHALVRDGRAESIERLEDGEIDGVRHWVLATTGENGVETRVWVSSETSLVSRLVSTLEIEMSGTSSVTFDLSDYREHDGVFLPGTLSQVIENLWVYEATFSETEIDPELPDSLFARPPG